MRVEQKGPYHYVYSDDGRLLLTKHASDPFNPGEYAEAYAALADAMDEGERKEQVDKSFLDGAVNAYRAKDPWVTHNRAAVQAVIDYVREKDGPKSVPHVWDRLADVPKYTLVSSPEGLYWRGQAVNQFTAKAGTWIDLCSIEFGGPFIEVVLP